MTDPFSVTAFHVADGQIRTQRGDLLATADEPHVPFLRAVARLFSGSMDNSRHVIQVEGADGGPLLVVDKAHGYFRAGVEVRLPDGTPVGAFDRSGGAFKPQFTVLDGGRTVIGATANPQLAYEFALLDVAGTEIASGLRQPDDTWDVRKAAGLPFPWGELTLAFFVAINVILDI